MAKNSPEQMAQSMIENMPEKTGKSLDDWIDILSMEQLAKHGQIVKHLKANFQVTHGFANLIAHKALAAGQPVAGGSDLVDQQYQGAKVELRPIYEAVINLVGAFGNDVEISPKKSYVSLRRSKQFGLIQPSTRERVDIGINLKGVEENVRLEASGSFNSMVSHRVRLTCLADVNPELGTWLRQAYEAA